MDFESPIWVTRAQNPLFLGMSPDREWILEHSGKVDIFKDHQREQEEKLVSHQLLSNFGKA